MAFETSSVENSGTAMPRPL